jgi:hypothetical protein
MQCMDPLIDTCTNTCLHVTPIAKAAPLDISLSTELLPISGSSDIECDVLLNRKKMRLEQNHLHLMNLYYPCMC